MNYVVSDIHGCYNLWVKILKKINFKDEDKLYCLGDAMDKGRESIRVMQDIMSRNNVIYVMGNHDYMALKVFEKVVNLSFEDFEKQYNKINLEEYTLWDKYGGDITLKQFFALSVYERKKIIDFLLKTTFYKVLEIKGVTYILSHAGIKDFNEDTDISELSNFPLESFIFTRPDFNISLFKDKNNKLIIGHTPTLSITGKSEIYKNNSYIDVDCGAIYGGKLAAYCIETKEEFYACWI
ncbi:MAG: fructose-bisphosphatase class III [Tissierellia bacterium]|nr:fructose-bisphosphatase class III [Tissierellia bacterium]